MLMYVLIIVVAILIIAVLAWVLLSDSEERFDPDDPMDIMMNSMFTQIASTDGKDDGKVIISSDLTAGQNMVMNLTWLTGYMVMGNWKEEDHFEAHISGECSSEKIAKVRAMVAQARNDCRVTIKHDTAKGPEIIYDN